MLCPPFIETLSDPVHSLGGMARARALFVDAADPHDRHGRGSTPGAEDRACAAAAFCRGAIG